MHFKWNYEAPTPEQQKSAKELGDKLNISPILDSFLSSEASTQNRLQSDSSDPNWPTSSILSS